MEDIYYKAINFISKTNKSNSLPYLGIDHLFSVYKQCIKILNNIEQRDFLKQKELLISALFHDCDHSGGKLSDFNNIQNAIKCVETFNIICKESNIELDIEFIKYLIRCTEFPYTVEDSRLTIEAKILRDADLCYLFDDLSIVKLYTGLRNEFNQTLFLEYCSKYEEHAIILINIENNKKFNY